jgi:hypothetical protein
MNLDTEKNNWGVAFVRETPLPPYQTWRPVPYYTYLIDEDRTKYYIGKRKDRPINIEAIKSSPILSFIFSTEKIEMDETVFLDWEGNYFIGKKDSLKLSEGRNIIYRNNTGLPAVPLLEAIKKHYKPFQENICYEKQPYRPAG